jgi:hypothetical protein
MSDTPTITYTWSIANLERHTTDGICYTAHYTVSANDGVYNSGAYGSIGLEAPAEGDPVIPYSDLTLDVVIGWVKEKLGGEEKVAEIHSALSDQISEQRSPSKAAGLPWSG